MNALLSINTRIGYDWANETFSSASIGSIVSRVMSAASSSASFGVRS
jgi:hypothetical protein